MSQTTLTDDDLFGEAASEIRADVESGIGATKSSLPTSDRIWDVDADNVLGVLNGLRSALDSGDAREHLRDAKKWYLMGQRADAFDEDDLETTINDLETLIETIDETKGIVQELIQKVPEIRSELESYNATETD